MAAGRADRIKRECWRGRIAETARMLCGGARRRWMGGVEMGMDSEGNRTGQEA